MEFLRVEVVAGLDVSDFILIFGCMPFAYVMIDSLNRWGK